MRARVRTSLVAALLLIAGAPAACKSRWVPPPSSMDAAVTLPDSGAPDGAAATALGPCLDSPSDLPRPPTGRLPCDLIPPGVRL